MRRFTTRPRLFRLRCRMVDGVSPDTAALLGHIVVVAETVLAGRPFHQPNVAAGVGLLLRRRTEYFFYPPAEDIGGFRLRIADGDRRRGGMARRRQRQVLDAN